MHFYSKLFADYDCALRQICPNQADFKSLKAYRYKQSNAPFVKSVYPIFESSAMTHLQ